MNKLTKKKPTKKDLIELKDLEEEDWRGILALTIIIGGFILVVLGIFYDKLDGVIGGIGTLMYAVAQWYFKSKEKKE